jgi:hypothetical protein
MPSRARLLPLSVVRLAKEREPRLDVADSPFVRTFATRISRLGTSHRSVGWVLGSEPVRERSRGSGMEPLLGRRLARCVTPGRTAAGRASSRLGIARPESGAENLAGTGSDPCRSPLSSGWTGDEDLTRPGSTGSRPSGALIRDAPTSEGWNSRRDCRPPPVRGPEAVQESRKHERTKTRKGGILPRVAVHEANVTNVQAGAGIRRGPCECGKQADGAITAPGWR